jgi:hypothetical protein
MRAENRTQFSSSRSIKRLQFVDQPFNHRQASCPERRIGGIEPEGRQKLGMMLGASGLEHLEILLLEAALGLPIDGVERVYQAVAEA